MPQHDGPASSKTDMILSPFLELAKEYSKKADDEILFLNELQSRSWTTDAQIRASRGLREIYSKVAMQLRECAQQAIQEGY